MKLKGISRFEQYADKIVFALFALFLVFVLLMQVGLLGGVGTVNVNGKETPIDRADQEVKLIADAKRARLQSDRVDERIPASLPSALETFNQAMAQSQQQTPPRLAGRIGTPDIRGLGVGSDAAIDPTLLAAGEFQPFVPPAPSQPLVQMYEGTIDPISVAQIGEPLAALLPPQQPFDIRAATILSHFDAAQLRAMLSGDEGGAAIPSAFWQGRVELLDVQVYRQERGSDGQWGQEDLISQIPGRFSLRDRLASGDVEPLALRSLLDAERGNREAIRRPAMYHAIAGEAWTWPKSPDAANPNQSQIDQKLRQLRGVRAEIARLQRLSEGAPPGGSGRDRDNTPSRPDSTEQIARRLEAQRALETQLIADLAQLGMDVTVGAAAAAAMERLDEPLASLTEAATETVTLWAHDLTVRPGVEYRYKARVAVTNPYFGQAERLQEESRGLAAGVAVYSVDSEWSQPLRVQPETVYFIRSASDASQDPVTNRSRAAAEIFRFYYGYWRKGVANLFPGDPLIAVTEELPALETWRVQKNEQNQWVAVEPQPVERARQLSTDLFLIDVTSDAGGGGGAGGAGGAGGGGAVVYLADTNGVITTRRPQQAGAAADARERLETSARLGLEATPQPPVGELSSRDDPGLPPPRRPGDAPDQPGPDRR